MVVIPADMSMPEAAVASRLPKDDESANVIVPPVVRDCKLTAYGKVTARTVMDGLVN